jgi:hypothetical protein
VASGKIPWYLVAYDRETGTQRNLRTYDQEDFIQLTQYPDGVYAKVIVAGSEGKPSHYEFYRLADGQAQAVASLPPPPAARTPVPKGNRPEVLLDTSPASSTRAVRLWYRLPGSLPSSSGRTPAETTLAQLGWRSASVPVTVTPFQVSRLVLMPDGRLVGATRPYGELFSFDPVTGQHDVLGLPLATNIYSMLVTDGKLYFTGYPSAPLALYDPARPWTFGSDTPLVKAPDAESLASNPRRLFYLMKSLGIHYGHHLVRDRAGRIYVGGHAERNRVGGGLAVYDPKSGALGGIGAPTLTNYDVAGLAATSDGGLIIYSSLVVTDPEHPEETPASAKLFVYDPGAGRFVKEWTPLPGQKSTGLLATGAPGQVVGVVVLGGRTTLYAIDVSSGQVVYRRNVVGSVGGAFRPGPDGQIWTFLGDALVRIRPDTGDVTPVGSVSSGAGDLAFAGTDLYLAGSNSLRRIRGIVPRQQ